jgi:hypothetical protein
MRKLRASNTDDDLKNSKSSMNETTPKKASLKTTISFALDSDIVRKLKKEAEESSQSLNAKTNAILRKYIDFYKMTEDFLDEIDETKYAKKAEELTRYFLTSLITQQQKPLTFDSLVSFLFEGIAKNAGNISHVSRYVDEKDGKTCLFFRHDYDIKWSRILGSIYSQAIEHFSQYTTRCEFFENGLEIKILRPDTQ